VSYRFDRSYQRPGGGRTVLGGSPLRLFRLGDAGRRVVEQLERGEVVPEHAASLLDRFVDAGVLHPLPAASPFTVRDVTVVVPTLDTDVDVHHDGPVVVVDDGSSRTVRVPAGARTVRLDVTLGPAAARQHGLAEVTTPLVAFVDADVTLVSGWLEPLIAHFADDRCALAAPRVRSTRGAGALASYERAHSPLDGGAEPARVAPMTRVAYVPSAALLCRTDALRSVGGFDSTLRFGEDVDLLWRLHEAGWRCRYEPRSAVEHEPRRSWLRWARQRRDYGSSAAPLATRHPGNLAPVNCSGWSVAVWCAVALRRPLLAIGTATYTWWALQRKRDDLPPATTSSLIWHGHLGAGRQLANAMRRVWWPLLVVALFNRRTRPVALAALAQPLLEWRPRRGPLWHQLLRPVDDVAYGVGVWQGVVEQRTLGPLVPRISGWPPTPDER
jgi:mycofactocin glycosyltransferase